MSLSQAYKESLQEFENLTMDWTDGRKLEKMAEKFQVPISVVAVRMFDLFGKDFLSQHTVKILEAVLEGMSKTERHEKHNDDKSWCGTCGRNKALSASRTSIEKFLEELKK